MSVILVDNAYFGHALRRARNNANIRRGDAAKMLRITHRKLMKYEHGTELIPGYMLERIIYYGLLMLSAHNNKA